MSGAPLQWLVPDWTPHPRVRACITTRHGDRSPAPWHGFNLGLNSGDDPQRVAANRAALAQALALPHPPHWLEQVHGVELAEAGSALQRADGVWSGEAGRACVVLTADCLPVLLARCDGRAVAAVHAGWKGLNAGILERAVQQLAPGGEPVSAWLGPAISQPCYQVGDDLREAFLNVDRAAADAFAADAEPGRWRLDLFALARRRLLAAGVAEVSGGNWCTATRRDLFYSYRFEGQTGRFASLVWLQP